MQPFKNFTLKDREKIREAYSYVMDDIKGGKYVDPYHIGRFDWLIYMSPIERNYWEYCRNHGYTVYPQVPCGNYFIDFARPKYGHAIEIDGEEYHQDIEADMKRQSYIIRNGYPKFERIRGKDTFALAELTDYENYPFNRIRINDCAWA